MPDYAADVEALWRIVDESYAYRDELGDAWVEARERALGQARRCPDGAAFLGVVERVVAFLADHHTHLGVNGPDSPPLVPSGTDLWAQWKDGQAVVTAVRDGSPAARAPVPVGAVAVSIDGVELEVAIQRLVGRPFDQLDPRQRDWALRTVLAGRRGRPRRLAFTTGGEKRTLTLDPPPAAGAPPEGERVVARRLDGEVGYVRIVDALGEPG